MTLFGSRTIYIALILLTSSLTGALAEGAAGQADTSGSRQQQPAKGQVVLREQRANIAPSKPQRNETNEKLNQIDKELAHTGPNPGTLSGH